MNKKLYSNTMSLNKDNLKLEHNIKSLDTIIHPLVYLYILSIPFQSLTLRSTIFYISPSEIIFFFLSPLAIIKIIISGKKLWINKLDLAIMGWLLANIIAGWHAGFDASVITEIIKKVHLVLLYFLLKLTIDYQVISKINLMLVHSALVASLLGIAGRILSYVSIDTSLVRNISHPYFNQIVQAQGFTPSPNMLASILMLGILIIFPLIKERTRRTPKDITIFCVLVLGFLLTISKSIFCLFIGLISVWYLQLRKPTNRQKRLIFTIAFAGITFLYFFGTHFMLIDKEKNLNQLKIEYSAGPPIAETKSFYLVPSQYFKLKKISLKASKQSFPWGLGPGKFNQFAHDYNINSKYPLHVSFPDPHSTYLGTLSELGLFGLLVLGGLIITVMNCCMKIMRHKGSYHSIGFVGIIACFIAISVEAISTDIMNFRHYWVILALASMLVRNSE